jgi:hypothetical protein
VWEKGDGLRVGTVEIGDEGLRVGKRRRQKDGKKEKG